MKFDRRFSKVEEWRASHATVGELMEFMDWFLRVTGDPDVQLAIVPDPLCVYWTES